MAGIQTGDFVLYPIGPASRWISRLVGMGQKMIGQAPTRRQYSHVAIVGPDAEHIFEAYYPRTRISPIALKGNEVYRIRNVTPTQVSQMMAYCQAHVGDRYDMLAILTLGFLQLGKTEVCSQLAYDAGLAAGIVLFPPEYLESPDDIAASTLLIRVT